MNRFVGLSLICLMFLSARAESDQGDSEFRGSSWSIQLSQKNGEPIKVKSEQKECDKTGVILHRRSEGTIENGKYKSISEQDLIGEEAAASKNRISRDGRNFGKTHKKDVFRMGHRRPFGIFSLENPDFKNRKDVPQMRQHPRGIFDFRHGEDMPQMKQHPRRYGKNLRKDFRKNFRKPFKESSSEDFEKQVEENFGGHEPMAEHQFARRGHRHPMFAGQMFDRRKHQHHPIFARQAEDRISDQAPGNSAQMASNMEDRLKNRSRVSFYRPVEKLFEKLFGIKKQNDKKISDLDRQNQSETEEAWKDMQEFENDFFDEEYFDAEE
ncbi:MAG: hypothetical protein J5821_03935 [Alphaproteobacteria bacterium]|nr:hypothetical protein [Alphaproteobacteria bacterium]